MIKEEELKRFYKLRKELFAAIKKALAEDGHCKHYEGQFGIFFPNYFENNTDDDSRWAIRLDCYVVGPCRHYVWSGRTFGEALERAEKEIRAWLKEA